MFITLKGLNTTEVQYRDSPSVDEQMLLFHSGPLDVVAESIETVKAAGHKQQAFEGVMVPTTSGPQAADPSQQGLGDEIPSGTTAPRHGGIRRLALPFVAGVAAGAVIVWLVRRPRG